MKFIKTKIVLSVMALAFLCVGVLCFSNVATAKADWAPTQHLNAFSMDDGAAVRASGDYNGISWVTTIGRRFYNNNSLTADAKFGVIVAPTDYFEGDLTHDTTLTKGSVRDIRIGSVGSASVDTSYRAVIDFSELGSNQDAAYGLKLTARAYVYFQDSYYYADQADTSRSAKQVAIAAEMSGELAEMSEELAAIVRLYYGGTAPFERPESNFCDADTLVINLDGLNADPQVEMEITGEIAEVYFGDTLLNGVSYNAETGKLTIPRTSLVSGEGYITVITDETMFAAPVIVADKVLTTMQDFEMFKEIRRNKNSKDKVSDVWSSDSEFASEAEMFAACKLNGYYVLGKDIDASTYAPGAIGATAGWLGSDKYVGKGLGLTGTFNGMGHVVSNYSIPQLRTGIFDLINGGTVKNFAMTNVGVPANTSSYSAAFSYLMIDPTFENVYIQTNYTVQTRMAGISYYIYGSTDGMTLKNVYLNTTMTYQGNNGVVYAAEGGSVPSTLDFSTTYMVSNCPIVSVVSSKAISLYCYAENEKATYEANPSTPANWGGISGNGITVTKKASGFTAHYAKDGYRYNSVSDMVSARGTEIAAIFTADNTAGCFQTVSGVPTWIPHAALA